MSRLSILLCAIALAPSAFGRTTPELSRDARQLTAATETMACKSAGHTFVGGRCGGGGAPLKCCSQWQKCVKQTSREWICADQPDGKDWVRQSWLGNGTKAPGYYSRTLSRNTAADKAKPAPAPAPQPVAAAPQSNVAFDVARTSGGSYSKVGSEKKALSTHFNGVGSPFGGCGTMASQLFDDNGKPKPFVALNFQDSSISAPYVQPATGSAIGAFENGANCGRWIEITLGDNCKGGRNTNTEPCIGGSYGADEHTGRTIYGFVADSCGDNNYCCRTDKEHLDISAPYLESLGMKDGWNGRKVAWSYIDGTAPGWSASDGLEFTWKANSKWIRNGKGFYADLIVSNTSDGLGDVEQDMGNGNWQKLSTNNWLGQQVRMVQPANYREYTGTQDRHFIIRVKDKSNRSYGTYRVTMNCEDSNDTCNDQTRAPAIKMA